MEITKVDLKRDLKHLYNPSAKEPVVVEVPPMNFLMISGTGDPNTVQAYKDAVETLYAVAYPLKFAVKAQQGVDYGVMPLEGLWWTPEDKPDYQAQNRDHWQWTMMMMQPEYVSDDLVRETIAEVKRKKNPPAIERLSFEEYDEGMAVQIMHIGPFSAEHATIMRMRQFMDENGYEKNGKHHEIYLADPRKSAPEKLKTVLREPLRRK